jgi:hypothetical protein
MHVCSTCESSLSKVRRIACYRLVEQRSLNLLASPQPDLSVKEDSTVEVLTYQYGRPSQDDRTDYST